MSNLIFILCIFMLVIFVMSYVDISKEYDVPSACILSSAISILLISACVIFTFIVYIVVKISDNTYGRLLIIMISGYFLIDLYKDIVKDIRNKYKRKHKYNNNLKPVIIRTQCKNCNNLFKYKSTEKPQRCPWCKSEL